MNILKKGRVILSLLLILCMAALVLTGCGGSDAQEPETEAATQAQKIELTTKVEDYSTKKPIEGRFFAERAFVNGFGVENELQEGDSFVSYYVANFGSEDLCQFMEAETQKQAAEMFDAMYDGIKETENEESVVDFYDINKGNFRKYVQIREGRYYAIVLLDNTLLFIDSSVEEQPRYEVFMADINY